MKRLSWPFIVALNLVLSGFASAETRSIVIKSFDDVRTSTTWPHLSFEGYLQFCDPRTHDEADMLRKGTFANTMINDSEILRRLLASEWKHKINFNDFYSGSIYAKIEWSDLEALRELLRDVAEVYDLTGATITLPGIPVP